MALIWHKFHSFGNDFSQHVCDRAFCIGNPLPVSIRLCVELRLTVIFFGLEINKLIY